MASTTATTTTTRSLPGIALVSIALAAYEAVAFSAHKPTISDLSHRYPYGMFVWGWMGWLALHFISESNSARRNHRGR